MSAEQTLPRAPIALRLRAETRDLHTEVESALAFLTAEANEKDYRDFLGYWHGFHRVLEPRLDAWHRREWLLDWPPRRKLGLLEADLRVLGVAGTELSRLPRCPDVPEVDCSATALGVLYVVEGATLGGAVLRRRLTSARIPADAFGFLTSYGDDVGRQWRGFRATATSWVEEHPGSDDQVVDAARRAFTALIRWTVAAGERS